MAHFVRQVYHVDGVTDRELMVKQARERADKGGYSVVHTHGAAKPCNSRCEKFGPALKPE